MAMHTTTRTFTVRPIPPAVAAELRRRDDAGHVPVTVVEADGGSPLRCCLRASRPGERLVLASYAPMRRWAREHADDVGAYDEVGPVFLHAEPCGGPATDGYPDEFRGSPRVLRAYGTHGRIVGGELVPAGGDPEQTIERLLADPEVAVVHVRAVVFGCFTFAVERAV
jgi:hypothetical protein